MRILILLGLATLFSAPSAHATVPDDFSMTIEPIVGYELQRKDNPPRTKLVLVYGARAIAGVPLLSGEAEYTRGKSEESFGTPTTQIDETSEKFRAGIRSQKTLADVLSLTVRGGAEAGRRTTKTTVNNVTTETKSPTKVDPYVGAGLGLHLGTQVSVTAEVVMTVKDTNDFKKNEYMTALGVRVNFNTR